ncbi:MAG TPA: phosphoribosyltransferase family protein [Acidimicrobiales bacterium]
MDEWGRATWIYGDRLEAGEALARELQHYAGRPGVVVLALPRGGVPVAAPVAKALGAPLDVIAVRKLGVPGHEELAMGAISACDVRILNPEVVDGLGIDQETVERVTRAEQRNLATQEERFRAGRPAVPIEGKTVILIDDGLATGSTMRAAITAARKQGARRVVVAVPVGAAATVAALSAVADEVICPSMPYPFRAVGLAYRDFAPVSDAEVRSLLAEVAGASPSAGKADQPSHDQPG